jgi:hypothetical protein
MSEDSRATLTGALWFFSALALVALFISAAAQGELTSGHILLAFTILGLAVGGTPFLLRMKDSSAEQDKMKRRRLDNLLRDRSDEDRFELKRCLADVDDNEASILDLVGDDGELMRRG